VILVLGVLIIASLLDIKYRAVPSVLLTGTLFIVLIMRIENIAFGISALIFAWFIKDILSMKELEFGVADIKIMATIGLMMPTMNMLLMFIGVFSLFQFVYTFVWEWKIGHDKERPFIPCLLIVYIMMMIIGGVT
jgi:hypothetical protein